MARKKTYLIKTAEGVGSALGHVAARVDAWKKERQAIAAHIHQVVQSAQGILNDLGHSAETATHAFEKAKGKGGRPKGYKMSAATKAKLKAAWARRKAAVGGEIKKDVKIVKKAVRTMSAEARARISAAQKKRWAKVKKG